MNIVILIAGIALLIAGAEIFVDSSVNIAKKLKIPTVVIALTIIGIGTSAPETIISVTASLQGSGDLSMSNITGANYFNLLFIIGLCALIRPIDVKMKEMGAESWLMVSSTVIFFLIMLVTPIFIGDRIPRIVGVVMVLTFIVYLTLLIRHALRGNRSHEHITHRTSVEIPHEKTKPLWFAIAGVAVGLGIILWGGDLTVSRAEMIAEQFNIPSRVIGLTIIGAGTSLPELIITLIACKKREAGMALGAIVGANIYNFLFILGIAGTIDPLLTTRSQLIDFGTLTAANILFLIFILTRKRISRMEGAVMLALYFGYMAYIIFFKY